MFRMRMFRLPMFNMQNCIADPIFLFCKVLRIPNNL